MNKSFLLFFVIAIALGCSDTPKPSNLPKEKLNLSEVPKHPTNDLSESESSYENWIDTIMKYSRKRVKEFDCPYDIKETLVRIDTNFMNEHLTGFRITHPQNWKLEYNSYSYYYFFDYEQLDSFILFTIIYDTEYGYDDYFTYTFDPVMKEITSVSCTAQNGGDGGAFDKEHLSFSQSGKELTVSTQSFYDEDILNNEEYYNCYTRSFDSIVTKFEFSIGKTTLSVDTIYSKVDTICYSP